MTPAVDTTPGPDGSSRRRKLVNLTLIVLVVALSLLATWPLLESALIKAFGPPAVRMREEFAAGDPSITFDHSVLDQVLRAHVGADGEVDYTGLHEAPADLDNYVESLASVELGTLGRDERLALLINAYNAFTLRLMLDHWPIESIRDIPAPMRWDVRRWSIGELRLSLTQLEHEHLRLRFVEPRVHFAINCASIGCPPLRSEAYTGARLDEQLADQARIVHTPGRWFRFAPGASRVELTQIYRWYAGDFEQVAGSTVEFAAAFAPDLRAALDGGAEPGVDWLPYDWRHNGVRELPR